MKHKILAGLLGLATAASCALTMSYALTSNRPPKDEAYPYHSARFTEFVNDSFRNGTGGDAKDFYRWMEKSYKQFGAKRGCRPGLSLTELLRVKKTELARMRDVHKKTLAEMDFAAWLHKLVRTTIPKFSLDRGFEFRNIVMYGERQCFLQSVLISGMLQEAGVRSGVAMVYKSISGEVSNNGHAITLVKLPNGTDIIVDASDPKPFARHQGLFVKTSDYRYVDPKYDSETPYICSYRGASNRLQFSTASVSTLGIEFLRSQFYYYRGERVPGALLSAKPTQSGLSAAQKYFEESVRACPRNPLSVYMLGRVYLAQGQRAKALRTLLRANKLYANANWVPVDASGFLEIAKHG
jgi:hypothetical protein